MKQWQFSPLAQGEYEHSDNGAGGKYKNKLVLRPSSIDSYIRCPYSFYKQQILGEYGAPNSASQVGTALHFVMEEAIGAKLKGEELSVDDMQRVGVRAWRDYNEKADIQYHGDQTYQSMADDLYAGVLGLSEALDCVDAVGSESRHSVTIDGDHPLFGAMSGSLDVEIPDGVVDLKFTGKKKSKPDDYVLQQSSYAMLREYNGLTTDKLQILNVVRPTKAAKAKADKSGEEIVAQWHIMEMKPNIPYVEHWVNIILNKTEQYANECEALDSQLEIAYADRENYHVSELEADIEQRKADFAELLFQGTSPSNSFLCNNTWCSHYTTCPHVEALRDAEKFDEVELFGGQ